MDTAVELTVMQVATALGEVQGKILRTAHGATKHQLGSRQPIHEYMTLVRDETTFWLRTLPISWTSKKSLQVARSAVAAVCKLPDFIEAHPVLAKEVKAALHREANANAIAKEVSRRNGRRNDEPDACGAEDLDAGSAADPAPRAEPVESQAPTQSAIAAQSQALREACLHVAQGSVIGVVLSGMWASGAFPMEGPHVLARAVEALYADKDSIEAFKIVMGSDTVAAAHGLKEHM